jgi:hypothetical protein
MRGEEETVSGRSPGAVRESATRDDHDTGCHPRGRTRVSGTTNPPQTPDTPQEADDE